MADTYTGESVEGKVPLPGGAFRPNPAKKNPGDWCPLVDLMEIYPGNRGTNQHGAYELYDAPVGIRLKVTEASKSEPFLVPETEWEGKGELRAGAVWQNEQGYHMIYMVNPPTSGEISCYAVSEDGYNWTRPNLGQVEFNGSRNNNIVANIPFLAGILEDPKAPPEERFKAMSCEGFWVDPDNGDILTDEEADIRNTAQEFRGDGYKGPRVQLRGKLVGFTSPDGIHWTKMSEPLAEAPSDGSNAPHYDPDRDIYFFYPRVHGRLPGESIGIGTGNPEMDTPRRSIGISRTKDFRKWPAPKLILFPDAQDDLDVSFYGCNVFKYAGRTDLHGMLLMVYHQATDQVDTQLAFSRDGMIWSRPERKAIIPVGPTGSGDECMVYPATGDLVELPDGYWAAAYYSMPLLHNMATIPHITPEWPQPCQVSWARWKPHRLCGIEAKTEGRFTIPAIFRTKNELRLNYQCLPGGWIEVELLRTTPSRLNPDAGGINGLTFEDCDRLTGDSTDEVVTWNGKSNIFGVGETVAIRIKMFQAEIFAYKV